MGNSSSDRRPIAAEVLVEAPSNERKMIQMPAACGIVRPPTSGLISSSQTVDRYGQSELSRIVSIARASSRRAGLRRREPSRSRLTGRKGRPQDMLGRQTGVAPGEGKRD